LSQERGCGTRKPGGLYVCVESDPNGMPVDYFVIDPALPFDLKGNLRAPYLLKDESGISHLVLGVGNTYYPFVPDFVEEARQMGVSKRVPVGYDFSSLVAGKSKLILIHKRAIPEFPYLLQRPLYEDCFRRLRNEAVGGWERVHGFKLPENERREEVEHECVRNLWDLSVLLPSCRRGSRNEISTHKVEVNGNEHVATVRTPSCSYEVTRATTTLGTPLDMIPFKEEKDIYLHYKTGAFLMFPTFHFEYLNKEGKAPTKTVKMVEKCGLEFKVVDE